MAHAVGSGEGTQPDSHEMVPSGHWWRVVGALRRLLTPLGVERVLVGGPERDCRSGRSGRMRAEGWEGALQKEKRHGRTPDPVAPSQGDSAPPPGFGLETFLVALAGKRCRGGGQGLLNPTAHTPMAYRKFPPEAEPPRPRGWPLGDLDGGSGWSDSARKTQEDGGGKKIQQRWACAGTCIQGLRGAEARQGQAVVRGGGRGRGGLLRFRFGKTRGLDSRGPRVEGGKDRLNCPRF